MSIDLNNAWVTDGEIYPNYALIGFKNLTTKKVISFELFDEDERLSDADALFIRNFLRKKTTVGFYSNNFDLVLYYAAIEGFPVWKLKEIANASIVDGMRPWEIAEEYDFKIDKNLPHIDLIEVAFGKASLKIYNGRLHGKRMQDLPYDPDLFLTDDQKEKVFNYWKNDLSSTETLYNALSNELNLRLAMTEEYRTDLMSKSDAQIAEAVMKAEIKKITGYMPEKPKKRTSSFYYDIPDYINFKGHAQLEDMLDRIYDHKFRVNGVTGKVTLPDWLLEPIIIGGREYQMGIGGLHSKEDRQHVYADENYLIIDRDVESYYPRIIINQELYPEHLGPVFLKVYSRIVNRRIKEKTKAGELKKERDEQEKNSNYWHHLNAEWVEHQKNSDSLKITINGLFGKLGNIWSIVYSPKLLIQVTLTGQLSLLQFIWDLHKCGIEVVSANTDGIVIRVHRLDLDLLQEVVDKWEKKTNFKTEETRYSHLYSADVNNYIAIKAKDGSVKTKGRFAIAEPGKPPLMSKNPTGEIVVTAVIERITKGTPLTKTIRECRDITKFLTVRTVKGGAIWAQNHEIVKKLVSVENWEQNASEDDDERSGAYLGKAIRWYYATGLESNIHYRNPNTKGNHNKVPKSENARPLMTLPDEFPDDVDVSRYVKEANQILREIAFYDEFVK